MKANRKIYWIVLLVVGLMTVLWPCSLIAQVEKPDLVLNIVYDGFRSLKAGEQRTMFLEVGNTGYRQLTDIRLSADSPEGWNIEFNPTIIDKLDIGGFQTVDMTLKTPDNAAKGDYNVAVIAQANETRRVTSVYIRVESSSLLWVWMGIGIAAVLIAGFVIIFIRFGREEK